MESRGTNEEETLKQQLALALGWDSSVAEGVVGAIVSAAGAAEVEDIVTNFMGGDPKARALVEEFLAKQAQDRDAARKDRVGAAPARQAHAPRGGHSQGARLGSSHLVMQEYQRQPVAGMRQAGSIQARVAKGKGKGRHALAGKAQDGTGEEGASAGRAVVRHIVNCLGCGKIYDIRDTRTDTQLFLESGGRCTFCGEEVPSLYGESPAASSQLNNTVGTGGSETNGETNDAGTTAALELKERLVEYDRNSAQRTSVIDDQSDYFAIDNVWLDETERRVLVDRQRLIEEAEAERKSRITVAVDLMGRQVVLAGEDDAPVTAQPGDRGSGGLGFASATDDLRRKMATAAEATAAEIPQGGGSAVADAERHSLRNMRISANPQLNGAPSPLFLPRAVREEASHAVPSTDGAHTEKMSSSKETQRKATSGDPRSVKPHRRRRAVQRLQHDDPFDTISHVAQPVIGAAN